MPVIQKVIKEKKLNDWLAQHAKNITSQAGEDGVLEKLFEILPVQNNWCVEFGAWDGKTLSNTWNLINNCGWYGALIEADQKRFLTLQSSYKSNNRVICLNKFVDFEGENTLDNILSKIEIPEDLDLLSIDIDGNDYHIWKSLNIYKPKVVVIEINPTIPNDVIFIQDRNEYLNQGASLLAMVMLGKEKGYELISTTTFNAIFVRREFFHLFGILDNSVELMHDMRPYETHLFQLYDGTMVLSGCNKMIWHGITINQQDIQVLPEALRVFPDHTRKKKQITATCPYCKQILTVTKKGRWSCPVCKNVFSI